jgi:hypothetical protein
MTDELEDVDLSRDTLDVGNVDYFLFLKDFYCDFLSCWDVDCWFYFTKGAFPKCLSFVGYSVPIT